MSSARLWLGGLAAVAAAILFAAFATEWWGGLVPCALCLVERWPYRVAIGLGVVGMALPRLLLRWMFVLYGVAMLGGVAAGVVHVGVEQGAWPSPLPECMAPNLSGLSMAERLARMPARPSKPCEDPTYLVPGLPVSMAAMNLVAALGLAGLAFWRAGGVRAL
jgi:disulfide bond formation protein DsbB